MATEGLKLFPDTTAQAEFNTVLQGVRAAKTTKAAAALKPKVDAAKQAADDAEKALDATHKAIARIREAQDYDPTAGPSPREQKLIAQEPAQRAEMKRTREEYWRLDQEHADTLAGTQAPAAPGQSQPAAAPTATNPQTGKKVIFRNGRWEPLQ